MICWLVDTSILLEILDVPGKSSNSTNVLSEFERKVNHDDRFYLGMTTLIETGNHIAQNGNGNQRYQIANDFVDFVKKALNGETPFKFVGSPQQEDLEKLINTFPEKAMRGISLGDSWILQDLGKLQSLLPNHDVRIWSQDQALLAYNQG